MSHAGGAGGALHQKNGLYPRALVGPGWGLDCALAPATLGLGGFSPARAAGARPLHKGGGGGRPRPVKAAIKEA